MKKKLDEPEHKAKAAVVKDESPSAPATITEDEADTIQPPPPGDEPAEVEGESSSFIFERASLQSELEDVQKQFHVLKEYASELSQKIDSLTAQIETAEPPPSNSEVIKAYIEKQNEIRAARTGRREEIIRVGVDPSEIVPVRAPIDTALASSKRRGAARPKYPAKT